MLVVLAALNLGAIRATALEPSKEDWRGAAAWVAAQAGVDDLILFTPPYIEAPFAYYYTRLGGDGRTRGYPFDHATVRGEWIPFQTPAEAVAGHRRVWLVTARHHRPGADLLDLLATRWQPAETWAGLDVTVRRFDRPPEGAAGP